MLEEEQEKEETWQGRESDIDRASVPRSATRDSTTTTPQCWPSQDALFVVVHFALTQSGLLEDDDGRRGDHHHKECPAARRWPRVACAEVLPLTFLFLLPFVGRTATDKAIAVAAKCSIWLACKLEKWCYFTSTRIERRVVLTPVKHICQLKWCY